MRYTMYNKDKVPMLGGLVRDIESAQVKHSSKGESRVQASIAQSLVKSDGCYWRSMPLRSMMSHILSGVLCAVVRGVSASESGERTLARVSECGHRGSCFPFATWPKLKQLYPAFAAPLKPTRKSDEGPSEIGRIGHVGLILRN